MRCMLLTSSSFFYNRIICGAYPDFDTNGRITYVHLLVSHRERKSKCIKRMKLNPINKFHWMLLWATSQYFLCIGEQMKNVTLNHVFLLAAGFTVFHSYLLTRWQTNGWQVNISSIQFSVFIGHILWPHVTFWRWWKVANGLLYKWEGKKLLSLFEHGRSKAIEFWYQTLNLSKRTRYYIISMRVKVNNSNYGNGNFLNEDCARYCGVGIYEWWVSVVCGNLKEEESY